MNIPVRGSTSKGPLTVMGTTGICSSSASLKAPRLKKPMWPVNVRAPSGKSTMELPSSRVRRDSSTVRFMVLGPDLSTRIWPAHWLAVPIKGMYLRLFFMSHLKLWPSHP